MCTFSKTELDFWFFWISFQREGSSLVSWLYLMASFFWGHPQSVSNPSTLPVAACLPGGSIEFCCQDTLFLHLPLTLFQCCPRFSLSCCHVLSWLDPSLSLFFNGLGSRGHRSEKLGMRIWKRRQCEVSEFYLLLFAGLNRKPGFRSMLSPGKSSGFHFPKIWDRLCWAEDGLLPGIASSLMEIWNSSEQCKMNVTLSLDRHVAGCIYSLPWRSYLLNGDDSMTLGRIKRCNQGEAFSRALDTM